MKKTIAAAICILSLCLLILPILDKKVSDRPAKELPFTLNLDEETAYLITGGNYLDQTAFTGGTIRICSRDPIGSVYILWGSYPDEWSLEVLGKAYHGSSERFLHEYITFEHPCYSLALHLPETETILSGIICFSPGVVPDSVERWLPPLEKADLLVFSTHSDDEFVFFGGLIPYYAVDQGKRVQVAYMTTNYYNFDRYRIHEALNGLWTAGVRNYPVTNMQPDLYCSSDIHEAYELFGKENFLRFQVEQIRRFKPFVVVTQDHNGEYGHGAHQLTAQSVEEAVVLAADSSCFPDSEAQFGTWDTPKTYLHLYGPLENRTVLDYETPSEALGGKTPFDVACAAFRDHVSQQGVGFEVFSYDSPFDSHSYGLFRSLVGPDKQKNDLFENLTD